MGTRIDLTNVNLHPRDIHEALESLETTVAQLRARGDARAVFPNVYAVITRRVREAIAGREGPAFAEPSWMSRLAGRFAEYYLETLVSSLREESPAATAWQIAHEVSARRVTAPVQDAVLGINAHVNYDLALGTRDCIVADGHAHDTAMLRRYKHDFDAVNLILAAAVPECLELLERRYGCRVIRAASVLSPTRRVMGEVALRVLRVWRERVWTDMLELVSGEPGVEARVRARMDRRSGLIARTVAVPSFARPSSMRALEGLLLGLRGPATA
jgi:hypothetical protein